jgi:hypothetical protein
MTDPDLEILARIQALAAKISLPELDGVKLQEAAFVHYNLQNPGRPKAHELLKVLGEGTKAGQDWVERRCVDYLRSCVATTNQQLTQLARQTSSPEVKAAITRVVYAAIAKAYPALAQVAEQACAHKLGSSVVPEPTTVPSHPEAPKGVQVDFEEEDQESNAPPAAATGPAETSERRLADLALTCLQHVNEYLIPEAAKQNISFDAATTHAWAMALFLAVSRVQTLNKTNKKPISAHP